MHILHNTNITMTIKTRQQTRIPNPVKILTQLFEAQAV